jgi:hypothetical protein
MASPSSVFNVSSTAEPFITNLPREQSFIHQTGFSPPAGKILRFSSMILSYRPYFAPYSKHAAWNPHSLFLLNKIELEETLPNRVNKEYG